MNDIIPTTEIQEGFRGFLELVPLIFVIAVLITSIALDIVNLEGVLQKGYKWKVLLICVGYSVMTYIFYGKEDVKIRDIPTLVLGCLVSILLVKVFAKWRKKKETKIL